MVSLALWLSVLCFNVVYELNLYQQMSEITRHSQDYCLDVFKLACGCQPLLYLARMYYKMRSCGQMGCKMEQMCLNLKTLSQNQAIGCCVWPCFLFYYTAPTLCLVLSSVFPFSFCHFYLSLACCVLAFFQYVTSYWCQFHSFQFLIVFSLLNNWWLTVLSYDFLV